MGITAVVGGIADAIATLSAGIGGAVAAGAGAIGVGAETAGIIGSIAGPAILGAGSGAALSAITGGNPLTGALTGALSGGAIGGLGGATGSLTSALGSQTAADALLGAGAGAIGSGLTGGNPLTGAVSGGLSGGAIGALGSSLGGGASGQAELDALGGAGTPPIPPQLDASGNPVSAGGVTQYGSGTQADYNAAMAQQAAASSPINPQSAQTAATSGGGILGGGGKGLLSNPALVLGALSAASSLFNKPVQGGYALPGPSSTSANAGNFNQRLAPPGTFPGASPVTPTVPNYYTYGQIPGGASYFNNNNLASYGFAKGGAMNMAANQNEFTTAGERRHVRGPGTGTSDSVPALLSNGEYVLTAKEVAAIGRHSNEKGAHKLDRLRKSGALAKILSKSEAA